jgi:hypothetical protein
MRDGKVLTNLWRRGNEQEIGLPFGASQELSHEEQVATAERPCDRSLFDVGKGGQCPSQHLGIRKDAEESARQRRDLLHLSYTQERLRDIHSGERRVRKHAKGFKLRFHVAEPPNGIVVFASLQEDSRHAPLRAHAFVSGSAGSVQVPCCSSCSLRPGCRA